jgi:hypothetical protein
MPSELDLEVHAYAILVVGATDAAHLQLRLNKKMADPYPLDLRI